MKKKKIGLVLSGGGAKGAYHLGVWKAIKELGLEDNIVGVSGTSIGALMGYMYSIKEYEKCFKFWYESAIDTNYNDIFVKLIGYKNVLAFNNIKNHNFLSTKKIDKLLENIVDINKLHNSKCMCYVTCHDYQNKQPETFLLNKYEYSDVLNILKATASIPLLFKKVKIHDKTYYDGGISDNTPIRPLYENGYDVIIVVYLNDYNHIDYRFFPSSKFIEISPIGSIGKFRDGVLDFSFEKINFLIQKGYREAYYVLTNNFDLLKGK